MKLFLSILILSFAVTSYGMTVTTPKFYAKVLMIKGKVSQLAPGMKYAKWIKKGDALVQDTSIVTGKKSFIKVKILADGSHITMGPNSKIVLTTLKKKRGTVLIFLTGTLRSKIEKDKDKTIKHKDPNKIYIKTRTAALGVRGTEFITVVNQENQVATLVTLEGEVAMAKIDPYEAQVDSAEVLKKSVESQDAQIVKKGRAATSYFHKEAVTKPTKVNPAQLVALKKNETLVEADTANLDKVENIKVTEELKKELYAPDTPEEIQEGIAEIPKKGAFVDMKSAIFIPKAKEDAEVVGAIDKNSGGYIPPEGVKLDVRKGFVAKAKDEKAKELEKKLNKHIEYEEVPNDYAPTHVAVSEPVMPKGKNSFSLKAEFSAINYVIQGSSEDTNIFAYSPKLTANLTHPATARRIWFMNAGTKFLSISKGEYDNEIEEKQDDDIAFFGELGFRYNIARDFALQSSVLYEEDIFPLFATDRHLNLGLYQKKIALPKLKLAGIINISNSSSLLGSYTQAFSNRNEDLRVDLGKTLALNAIGRFGQTKNHHFDFGLSMTDYFYNDTELRKYIISLGYGCRF